MKQGDDVLSYLESIANQNEKSRSSFWETELEGFSFTKSGQMEGLIPIGSISRKVGPLHTLAHRILQWPYRNLVRGYSSFKELEHLGRTIAERQSRQFTLDMLRQVLSLTAAMDNCDLRNLGGHNVVIGDGFGVLTSLLRLADPEASVVCVNLSVPLLIDLVYTQKALPGETIVLPQNSAEMRSALQSNEVGIVALLADQANLLLETEIKCAFNVHSMQEMTLEVIGQYFDFLRGSQGPETYFYCCNRIHKKLYDGEEIRFFDFPWQDGDDYLLDEECRWDDFEYNQVPPFWFANPHKKHHRFAQLAKHQHLET